MSLRDKLKMKTSLKAQLEKEATKGGGKNDPRFLNYYDMKDGQKMTLLLVPSSEGDLWKKYKTHGPNLKVKQGGKDIPVRGAGSVNCSYHSNGQECPACQKGFDLLNLSKETGDKEYKEEAKKWFGKDHTVASVLVIESPIEINDSPDGNQVKLINLPYKVEQMIHNHISEGIIPEDELYMTPLVLKKTVGGNGMAAYDTSYFERKPVGDDILEVLDEMKVDLFDYDNLDAIPSPTTTEEVQEWLTKAEEVYEKAQSGGSEGEAPKKSKPSVQEKLAARKAPVQNDEDDSDDQQSDAQEQNREEEPAQKEEAPSGGNDLRARLNRLKNRG